jgi:hypothetical protein
VVDDYFKWYAGIGLAYKFQVGKKEWGRKLFRTSSPKQTNLIWINRKTPYYQS